MSNFRWLRYEWIWEKSRATRFLNAKKAPLKAHENILVFYDRAPGYHPQFSKAKPYRIARGAHFNPNHGQVIGAAVMENSGYRYPRSILRFASGAHTIHPTQKPVALFEYLVRTYTNPGELVLDSCIGSGTTAIACLNSGRRFIGFEKDKRFFGIAHRRIVAHRRKHYSRL